MTLQREPDNPIDRRAIRVLASATPSPTDAEDVAGQGEAEPIATPPTTCVGMLDWRLAHDLSPLLDSGAASIVSARVTDRRGQYELTLCAQVAAWDDSAASALAASDALNGRKLIAVGPGSLTIGDRDAEDAASAARRW